MHQQDCLPDRVLESLVATDLGANERIAAQKHLSDCPSCRNRLAEMLDDTRRVVDERAPEELKRIARDMVRAERSSSRVWLPLAAAVLVAIGIGLIWRPTTPDRDAGGVVLRDLPRRASLALALPLAGEVEAGERARFSWEAIDSARRYDFELVNEVGDVVFEASTTEPSVELLRGNLAIEPGGTYYWSVRALLRDGTLVESKLRSVLF